MNAKQRRAKRRAKRRAAQGAGGWVEINGHRIYTSITGRAASDIADDIARQARALGFNARVEVMGRGATIHFDMRVGVLD